MGSFYTNITLATRDVARVKRDLASRGLSAFISQPEEGGIVVFERGSDEQDPAVLDELAANLSARVDCAALAVLNHDDDVLLYSLYRSGQLLDTYNSAPDYFGDGAEDEPGGDPEELARVFGRPERTAELATILGLGHDDEGFVFETDRHQQLVEALGLPTCAVGTGFTYLSRGEYPVGYESAQFEAVNAH